ncbi:MAG: hypothetical protein J0H31_01615 [Alphaproteobacteria bacterium]|nr:hypothetical protein [Alphaproteobacteria bacterium]
MRLDFLAQTGGELQITISVIRPCNREQCLERHGGGSLFTVHWKIFTPDAAVAGRSASFLALNQIDPPARLIPVNVRAPRAV